MTALRFLLILAMPLIAGMFMPALGALMPIFMLILKYNFSKSARLYLSIVSIFFSSVTISSRAIGLSLADDFSVGYWPLYQDIANGQLDKIFQYGDGFEPGLGILFFGISTLISIESPRLLLFLVVFINQLILIIFIEFILIKYSDENKFTKQLTLALTLFFFSTFMASQLLRQSFSSIFLLMAVFSKEKLFRYILLFIGSMFHLTALPFYLLMKLMVASPKLTILILAFSGIIIGFFSNELIYFLLSALNESIGYSKIVYYEDKPLSGSILDNGLILTIQLILVFMLFTFNKTKSVEFIFAKRIYLAFFILFFILLTIPLASLRSTLLISSVAYGYFFVQSFGFMLARIPRLILATYMLIFVLHAYFLSDPSSLFRLWYGFDPIGSFGYFFKYLV